MSRSWSLGWCLCWNVCSASHLLDEIRDIIHVDYLQLSAMQRKTHHISYQPGHTVRWAAKFKVSFVSHCPQKSISWDWENVKVISTEIGLVQSERYGCGCSKLDRFIFAWKPMDVKSESKLVKILEMQLLVGLIAYACMQVEYLRQVTVFSEVILLDEKMQQELVPWCLQIMTK